MWSCSPIALPYQNIQEFHIDDYVPPTLEFKETAPCVGPAIVVPIATGEDSDDAKELPNAAAALPPKKRGRPTKKARAPVEIAFSPGPCEFKPFKPIAQLRDQREATVSDSAHKRGPPSEHANESDASTRPPKTSVCSDGASDTTTPRIQPSDTELVT